MEWLKPTLLHTLAVGVSLAVAVVLSKVLKVEGDILTAVLGLVLVALEKFIRSSEKVPIKDYVNE